MYEACFEKEIVVITFEQIKKNEEIRCYISSADQSLRALGYTEHSFGHVELVANRAAEILRALGADDREILSRYEALFYTDTIRPVYPPDAFRLNTSIMIALIRRECADSADR